MTELAEDYDWQEEPLWSFERVLNVVIPVMRQQGVSQEKIREKFEEKLDHYFSETS